MNLLEVLKKAKTESRKLAVIPDTTIRHVLYDLADTLLAETERILKINWKDLTKIKENDPIYDRIFLDEERVKAMSRSVREIADYDSPIGKILEEKTLKNGLNLKKVSVPLGVVGAIFEARPNVVTDIFALCFKAKNACILKGGSDCNATNEALMKLIKKSMEKFLKNSDAAVMLTNDKKIVGEFMKADKYVNVLIPRGGAGLIEFVRKNSSIPVIETGAGVVHVFFDESGKTDMGKQIVLNAKTQRPSVCNAMDTLLVHEKKLPELPDLCVMLEEKSVEIFADTKAYEALKGRYKDDLLKKAEKDSFGCEFLSLKMAVKTVAGVDEAIEHINTFGSGHSETIITDNRENAEKFLEEVDAACVYVNASTRFTDGGEFGMGAEVGISTQKLHARGPMGLRELTSYKWEIVGDGQVR